MIVSLTIPKNWPEQSPMTPKFWRANGVVDGCVIVFELFLTSGLGMSLYKNFCASTVCAIALVTPCVELHNERCDADAERNPKDGV